MTLESLFYEEGWWVCLLIAGAALALWLQSVPKGASGMRERGLLFVAGLLVFAPLILMIGTEWIWPKCSGRTNATDVFLSRAFQSLLVLQVLAPLPACIVAKGRRLRAVILAAVLATAGVLFSLLVTFPFIMGDCAPNPISESGAS